jgi:hypothetical protein
MSIIEKNGVANTGNKKTSRIAPKKLLILLGKAYIF